MRLLKEQRRPWGLNFRTRSDLPIKLAAKADTFGHFRSGCSSMGLPRKRGAAINAQIPLHGYASRHLLVCAAPRPRYRPPHREALFRNIRIAWAVFHATESRLLEPGREPTMAWAILEFKEFARLDCERPRGSGSGRCDKLTRTIRLPRIADPPPDLFVSSKHSSV
jgi:hypothetical protein